MSIYDIPLKSWDGKENILDNYKGKVTLIINVTADCGNAPQFGVIETIYEKYKNLGFDVLAIPTNDYCGDGITYGDYACGIASAEEAREYAQETYDVTYDFSELVVSKPGEPIDSEMAKSLYGGRTDVFPRQLSENETTHEVFEKLCDATNTKGMYGNFEKWLLNRDGVVMRRYTNATLLDFGHKTDPNAVGTAEEEYERLCNDIEDILEDNYIVPDKADNWRSDWDKFYSNESNKESV